MGYILIIIVCAVLGAIILSYEIWDGLLLLAGGVLGAAVGAFVCIIVGVLLSEAANTKPVLTEQMELYPVQEGNREFYVGKGSVDGERKFLFSVEEEFGTTIKSEYVSNVDIVEDNKETPAIRYYDYEFRNSNLQAWFPEFVNDPFAIITVPKGSIKYDYNLDIE